MKFYKLWVLVGGTGRKIGKTTLAGTLILKLKRFGSIVGIKISNIKPDGLDLHGNHSTKEEAGFSIWEETKTTGDKDSMRFLKAGAERSFFIQTGDEYLEEAFQKMLGFLDGNEIVVCESNSLRSIMRPAVFLIIKGENNITSKTDIAKFLDEADYIVNPMDLKQFKALSDSIGIRGGQIKLTFKKDQGFDI